MKTIIALFVTLFVSLPAFPQQGRQLAQEKSTASPKRIALVIGNAAYENAPPLKNPANDATDIAGALSKVGFSVDHGVNLTQRRMKAMIREFGQKLKGSPTNEDASHGVCLPAVEFRTDIRTRLNTSSMLKSQQPIQQELRAVRGDALLRSTRAAR